MRNEKQNDKKNTNIWNKSRLDPVLQALHYGGKWLIPAPNTTRIVDRDSYNFVDTGTLGLRMVQDDVSFQLIGFSCVKNEMDATTALCVLVYLWSVCATGKYFRWWIVSTARL